MNKQLIFSWSRTCALGLLLSASLNGAWAATHSTTARTRSHPTIRLRMGGAQPQPLVRPSTDPTSLMSQAQWRRYVNSEIPTLDKVKLAPFAVEHQRRYERGETIVSPSNHTF